VFLICFEIHLSLDVSFCTSIEGEKKHVCIEPQSITLCFIKNRNCLLFTSTWVHPRSAWGCLRIHGFTIVQLGGVHEYMGSPSFSLVVFTSTWVHPRSAWWCSRVHGFTLVQLGGVCVALFCFLCCVFALYVSCLPLRCSLTFIYTYVNVTKRHPTILINKR
jgi:hypothetical protein